MAKLKSAAELEVLRKKIASQRDPKKTCITICSGTGCHAHGSEKVVAAFREEIAKRNLGGEIDFRVTGCHGFCEQGPLVFNRRYEEDSEVVRSRLLAGVG